MCMCTSLAGLGAVYCGVCTVYILTLFLLAISFICSFLRLLGRVHERPLRRLHTSAQWIYLIFRIRPTTIAPASKQVRKRQAGRQACEHKLINTITRKDLFKLYTTIEAHATSFSFFFSLPLMAILRFKLRRREYFFELFCKKIVNKKWLIVFFRLKT